jgi:hypothetical protein
VHALAVRGVRLGSQFGKDGAHLRRHDVHAAFVHQHSRQHRAHVRRDGGGSVGDHLFPLSGEDVPLGYGQHELFLKAHVLEEPDGQLLQRLGERLAILAGRTASPGAEQLVDLGEDALDAPVVAFHEMDDRVDVLGCAGKQQGPQDLVLAGVVVVQHQVHQPDVPGRGLRAFVVPGRHGPHQTRQQGELPPEHGVHLVHVARVGVRVSVIRHGLLPPDRGGR